MSRCFPYPPPGFELKRKIDLDVIESIETEKEKTKKERKEEKKRLKKEKKEKKREKKEKRKRETWEIEQCNSKKELEFGHKEKGTIKKGAEETEQLEKSCLTEEQIASAQNLYDSSDSTQNSNKRKRHISPPNRNHSSGSSIVIRLPVPKPKDPETPPIKEHLPSISVRTEIAPHKEAGILLPRPTNQQSCSTSGRTGSLVQDQAVAALTSILSKSDSRAQDSPFSRLIENWVPPTIPQNLDFDDQEWLFDSKHQSGQEAKSFKHSEDDLCQSTSSLWPRACYLPSADMYILPYTVPF